MAENRRFRDTLIRGARVDADGDYFTLEALEGLVAAAKVKLEKGDILATQDFSNEVADIQGRVLDVNLEGGDVTVEVEMYPTATTNKMLAIEKAGESLGVAFGGVIHEKETVKKGGKDVTELRKVHLTGVSLVPAKKKVF